MIDHLPLEILEKIFSYCSGISLLRLSVTCSRLYDEVRRHEIWKRRLVTELPRPHLSQLVHASIDSIPSDEFNWLTNDESCRPYVNWSALCNLAEVRLQYSKKDFKQQFCQVSQLHVCCQYVITGSIDGTVQIFDSVSLHRVKELRHHEKQITGISCHCIGGKNNFPQAVIVASTDSRVSITRYANYMQVGDAWSYACGSPVTCMSKFGARLLVGLANGDVRLLTVSESEGKINSAALFSHQDRLPVQCVDIGMADNIHSLFNQVASDRVPEGAFATKFFSSSVHMLSKSLESKFPGTWIIFEIEDDDVPANLRTLAKHVPKPDSSRLVSSCLIGCCDTPPPIFCIRPGGLETHATYHVSSQLQSSNSIGQLPTNGEPIRLSCSFGPITCVVTNTDIIVFNHETRRCGQYTNTSTNYIKVSEKLNIADIPLSSIRSIVFGISRNGPALFMIDSENTCHAIRLR